MTASMDTTSRGIWQLQPRVQLPYSTMHSVYSGQTVVIGIYTSYRRYFQLVIVQGLYMYFIGKL